MRALVVAKAPVPGRVKTRLGVDLGDETAARLAAAALLDTLDACRSAFEECHLALEGGLEDACDAAALRRSLVGWVVHPQRGDLLGERLAHAHQDAAGPGPTVQIGMDTPQVTGADLRAIAARVRPERPVLGRATDGGWWVLASWDSAPTASLAGVPMSRPDTFARTRDALTAAGQTVTDWHELTDVDTTEDAVIVADALTRGHFLRAWQSVGRAVTA